MASEDLKDTFWWCLDHRRVEPFEESDSTTGSARTTAAQEAAGVLDRIAERERQVREGGPRLERR